MKEDKPMMAFQFIPNSDLVGRTIIEHRAGGENIVGKIENASVKGDRTFAVDWHHHDGLHRKTMFLPSCWDCDIVAGIIFLKRTAKEPAELELVKPWSDANLYTLVWQADR
jgi:hypothetical protein